jgi:membrane-associated phospholipid phosphatase
MFLERVSDTPSLFSPFAILIALVFLLRRIAFYPLGYPDAMLAQCEIALLTTKWLVSALKFVFGRTWPLYSRPSFLTDGAYGFNFFSAGLQYASFPSGHAASICVLCMILWKMYPRFKLLYAGAVAAMTVALVLGNFHFVSDVIAGGLLGASVSALVTSVWEFMMRERLQSAG